MGPPTEATFHGRSQKETRAAPQIMVMISKMKRVRFQSAADLRGILPSPIVSALPQTHDGSVKPAAKDQKKAPATNPRLKVGG